MKELTRIGFAAAALAASLQGSTPNSDVVSALGNQDSSLKVTYLKDYTGKSVESILGNKIPNFSTTTEVNNDSISELLNSNVGNIEQLIKTGNVNFGINGQEGTHGDAYSINVSGQVDTNGVFENSSTENKINSIDLSYTLRPSDQSAITASYKEQGGEKSTFLTGEHIIPGTNSAIHATVGKTDFNNKKYGDISTSNLEMNTYSMGVNSKIGNTEVGLTAGVNKVSGNIDGENAEYLEINPNNHQTFISTNVGPFDATVWNTKTMGQNYKIKYGGEDTNMYASWGPYDAHIVYDKNTNIFTKTPLSKTDLGVSLKLDDTKYTSNSNVNVYYSDKETYSDGNKVSSPFVGLKYFATFGDTTKQNEMAQFNRAMDIFDTKTFNEHKADFVKKYGDTLSNKDKAELKKEIVTLKKKATKLAKLLDSKKGDKTMSEIYQEAERLAVNGTSTQFTSPEIFESQKNYIDTIVDDNDKLENTENKIKAAESVLENKDAGKLATKTAMETVKNNWGYILGGVAIAGALSQAGGGGGTSGTPLEDTATVLGAPTLDSVTQTSIFTTPGTFTDADGVQNITTKIYSDASLTTLVGTDVNADFAGLTDNTTYYIVTEGEALNRITKGWDTKVTPTLTVTTVENLADNTTFSWVGTTPNRKNTSYTGLIIQTNQDYQTLDSLASTGTITNEVKLGTNQIQFDWITPNAGATLTATVTASDGDQAVIGEAVILPLSNAAPVLSGATATGDIHFGDNLTNIGLNIADDNLASVTWTLSYTKGGTADTGVFSQTTGTGNTLSGITFTPTSGASTLRTIKATVVDSVAGSSEEVTIYSN